MYFLPTLIMFLSILAFPTLCCVADHWLLMLFPGSVDTDGSTEDWVQGKGRPCLHTRPWELQQASLAVAASPPYSQQVPMEFQDPLVALTAGCWVHHLFPMAWIFSFEVGGWGWGWLPNVLISGFPHYCLFSF